MAVEHEHGMRHQDTAGLVRTSILDTTYDLLISRGYADVTTDDIAAAAKVSKATIYRHWRTKQELVVAAARKHFGDVEAPTLDSFADEIGWILEHRSRDYREPGTLRLVGSLVGAATTDPQLQALFAEWVEQLSRAVRSVIQRGIARGDVRPDVDILALETLVAGVVARAVVAQHSFTSATVESLVEMISTAAAPEA
ncbi:MAG: TetR/AcrR family transcriptional regulator [Acidimicrobiia bacterium]|nr:TetR/AcrR family transcriptional regulator [Acidimicrobiia bacterium]